jgi:tRNA(Arg) A34 adenosine deaminase TadA
MKLRLYIDLAAATASRDIEDARVHCLGAVGIRSDGAIVRSRNGSAQMKMPSAHAEARLAEKLDYNATVFVCRVRKNGQYGMAKPCIYCQTILRMRRVKRVYFTTDIHNEYGVMEL